MFPSLLEKTGRFRRKGLIVGVSGPIAAGKSTASLFLAGLGAHEIDVDAIGHKLLRDENVIKKIIECFGSEIVDSTGHLSRRKLACIAFQCDDSVKKLNDILHPLIIEATKKEVAESRYEGTILVINAALLFEAGIDELCDYIILVTADESVREQRAITRRGWTAGEMARRESFQMPLEEKIARSHFVITNNGNYEELHSQVEMAYKEILNGKRSKDKQTKHENSED